jgi:hypothetical protein
MSSVRRLTAILAADRAGYSRLMGADEEGTRERLTAHLAPYPTDKNDRMADQPAGREPRNPIVASLFIRFRR